MPPSVKLVSVATAVPPYVIEQRDAAAAAARGFAARYGDFERLARVFTGAGIRRRYAVRPIEWCFEPLGWPERTSAYLDGACQLFVDAATKALDAAGVGAADVDTVVTSPLPVSKRGLLAVLDFAPTSSECPSSASAAPGQSPDCQLHRAWRNRVRAASCC